MGDRILWNTDDTIDEIVATGVTVHIEQMDDHTWWIELAWPDGTTWAGNFHTPRAQLRFTEQESDHKWAREDRH